MKLNMKARKKIKINRFSARTFWILSISSIALLSVVYIFQVNGVANASRQISIIQERLDQFARRSNNLEPGFVQAEPFPDLELLAGDLDFEKIGKIQYIDLTAGAVAVK